MTKQCFNDKMLLYIFSSVNKKDKHSNLRSVLMVWRKESRDHNSYLCKFVCLEFLQSYKRRGTWIYGVVKMFPLIHPDFGKASIVVVDNM